MIRSLHLSEKNNLSFQQICDKKAINIEYPDNPYVFEEQLENKELPERPNEDPGPNVRMQDYRSTDTVGDTELISTFIERSKITDITWTNRYFGDLSIGSQIYKDISSNGYQCVPPHKYEPWYIWTVPQQQGLAM